jgi:hypothetical protein
MKMTQKAGEFKIFIGFADGNCSWGGRPIIASSGVKKILAKLEEIGALE